MTVASEDINKVHTGRVALNDSSSVEPAAPTVANESVPVTGTPRDSQDIPRSHRPSIDTLHEEEGCSDIESVRRQHSHCSIRQRSTHTFQPTTLVKVLARECSRVSTSIRPAVACNPAIRLLR